MSNPESVKDVLTGAGYETVDLGSEIHSATRPAEEVFDASIHCTNPDGSPKRKSDGSFRKRPLRKAKSEVVGEKTDSHADFNSPASVSCVQMVGMVLDVGTLLAVKFLGDEFRPSTDERQILQDTWARYCQYKGWDLEATPELVVASVTLAFLMPRIMSPKFMSRFLRKKNAHVDNGANGNGQNNTGQNIGNSMPQSGTESGGVRPNIDKLGG